MICDRGTRCNAGGRGGGEGGFLHPLDKHYTIMHRLQ